MKQVVIGINQYGEPYVVSSPKNIEIIFKPDKATTFKKQIRRIAYRVKCLFKG